MATGFTTQFIYEAIDKVSKTQEVIRKNQEKIAEAVEKGFKRQEAAASKFETRLKSVANHSRKFALASVAGLIAISKAGSDFETSIASLSAITGLQGDALASLRVEIMKTGEQFGIASKDIAGGMELIGSLQPELLKTPKILLAVTRAAATLSKASGQAFSESAQNLAGVMNQFELGANQVNRVINVLAAGSKEGASQIPELSAAIATIGPVALQASASLESVTGILEVAAAKQIKGSAAGRSLAAIWTRLAIVGGRELSPAVVGVDQSLLNLKAKFDAIKDPVKRSKLAFKLFGLENQKLGLVMVDNAQKMIDMKNKVTGTSVAHQQAAITSNTFAEKLKKLWVIVQNKLIKAFDDLRPALISAMEAFGTMVQLGSAFVETWPRVTKFLLVAGPAIWIIAKATQAWVFAQKSLIAINFFGWLAKSAVGAKLLNLALAAGPLGVYAAGLAAIALAAWTAYEIISKVYEMMERNKENALQTPALDETRTLLPKLRAAKKAGLLAKDFNYSRFSQELVELKRIDPSKTADQLLEQKKAEFKKTEEFKIAIEMKGDTSSIKSVKTKSSNPNTKIDFPGASKVGSQ